MVIGVFILVSMERGYHYLNMESEYNGLKYLIKKIMEGPHLFGGVVTEKRGQNLKYI